MISKSLKLLGAGWWTRKFFLEKKIAPICFINVSDGQTYLVNMSCNNLKSEFICVSLPNMGTMNNSKIKQQYTSFVDWCYCLREVFLRKCVCLLFTSLTCMAASMCLNLSSATSAPHPFRCGLGAGVLQNRACWDPNLLRIRFITWCCYVWWKFYLVPLVHCILLL